MYTSFFTVRCEGCGVDYICASDDSRLSKFSTAAIDTVSSIHRWHETFKMSRWEIHCDEHWWWFCCLQLLHSWLWGGSLMFVAWLVHVGNELAIAWRDENDGAVIHVRKHMYVGFRLKLKLLKDQIRLCCSGGRVMWCMQMTGTGVQVGVAKLTRSSVIPWRQLSIVFSSLASDFSFKMSCLCTSFCSLFTCS